MSKFSINPDKTSDAAIVVPITAAMGSAGRSASKYDKYMYKTSDPITPIATVEMKDIFPFELGFSMTVHKAQGRTLDRIVVDLTNHPTHYTRMKFAAVFVAMSRVRCSEHIRLLHHADPSRRYSFEDTYSYLTELRPCRHAQAFMHGYTPDNAVPGSSKWDRTKALGYSTRI